MLSYGGYLSKAVSRYATERGMHCITWAIGGDIINSYDKVRSSAYQRERSILLASKLVVCVSEDIESKVRQMTDERVDTMTFYTGVDTDNIRPDATLRSMFRLRLGYDEEEIVFCFVGHLIGSKGVFELLRTFAHIAGTAPSLRLLLIGSVIDKRKIKKSIKQLNIQSYVKMTGPVNHDQIAGYLNAADIFVFPSWSEGLPNAVIEASSTLIKPFSFFSTTLSTINPKLDIGKFLNSPTSVSSSNAQRTTSL